MMSTVMRMPCIWSVEFWMESSSALGRRAMMFAKMINDMPLPMPRCVMSSPIHMMRAVPETSVMMMTALISHVGMPVVEKSTPKAFWNRTR